MSRRVYFENLDGLRFICFLLVFFYHSFYTEYSYIKESSIYGFIKWDLFGNGNLGVNFFFVLSGFLITYLLIQEKHESGTIDIRKFYVRRVLRIWPLYFFCVFFGFVIFPLLKSYFGQEPDEIANIFSFLTFTNNFDFIYNGRPDASILGVLWSIAIEEQFYLIWPLLLYYLPLRKYWVAFTVVVLVSICFRAMYDSRLEHEYHTLSCINDMAVGAFAAWLIYFSKPFKRLIENLNRDVIILIYVIAAVILLYRSDIFYANYYVRIFERLFISLLFAGIILEQNYSRYSFFKMSHFKNLSKLGLVTYGLYCLHFIGILIATNSTKILGVNNELWQVLVLDTLIGLSITIFISLLSYKFFEKPFLKLKLKIGY